MAICYPSSPTWGRRIEQRDEAVRDGETTARLDQMRPKIVKGDENMKSENYAATKAAEIRLARGRLSLRIGKSHSTHPPLNNLSVRKPFRN